MQRDPHAEAAAQALGESYEHFAKRLRQGDKAAIEARAAAKLVGFCGDIDHADDELETFMRTRHPQLFATRERT